MPNRSIQLTVATSLALLVAAALPAVAATPRNATLTVKGGTIFKPNRFIGDGMRFGRDVTVMKSRGTLTITNRTREPHTFSIVRKSQVPRTARQAERCTCQGLGQPTGFVRSSGSTAATAPRGRVRRRTPTARSQMSMQ